jgi:plexin A
MSSVLQLELLIENLPTLSGQFLCAFTALDKTLITNATRKSYGVNCTTPRTDLLPSIPQGQRKYAYCDVAACVESVVRL